MFTFGEGTKEYTLFVKLSGSKLDKTTKLTVDYINDGKSVNRAMADSLETLGLLKNTKKV
jgi:hypothetical protein